MKSGVVALSLVAIAVVLGAVVLFMLPTPEAPRPAPRVSSRQVAVSLSSRDEISALAGQLRQESSPPKTLPSLPAGMSWEDRLDELLSKDTDTATTVRGLVGAMRGLPTEAQEEYASHAVNLCEDEQFNLLAGIYLDPKTPPEVAEIIFNDVLNRPDEIKLPLLANTLRNSSHPMATEAKEILEMYLDLEPGSAPPGGWAGWDQAVKEYLAEQTAQ